MSPSCVVGVEHLPVLGTTETTAAKAGSQKNEGDAEQYRGTDGSVDDANLGACSHEVGEVLTAVLSQQNVPVRSRKALMVAVNLVLFCE